jgi:competence protein ComEA
MQRRLLAGLLLWPATRLRAEPAPLELNSASRAELESLAGIGLQLAERLLAARSQALFADWADLRRRVPGIGTARARRLSAQGLRVNGQSFEAPPASMSGLTQSD